ncbi:dihydroorotase [Lebetimonas natsushimae]|uniref:Dihydroorotase n=1 Tax=Lebetimonas natsushimae TaxID=1936991 RepID=A0A292YB94_9BACT|nr:dihydroorotase [Lebetimonas natsushimae]GAX86771.1 dihydroorotase [Lebetimonas natsushimae]
MIINTPIDMHLHLREGDILKDVLPYTENQFAAAVVMPNLVPPVDNKERLLSYKEEILKTAKNFIPLMNVFMRDYNEDELLELKELIFAIKLYPAGITTNSEGGVKGIESVYPVLEMMQEFEIPLSVHGETHGFVMEREREFIPVYEKLARDFPKLKIIMEHVGTAEMLDLLDKYDNLYATVTLHHLLLTLDDVAGGMLNPHYFCKPIIKTPKDRDAIQRFVKSGHKKVMFGSDSAPHPLKNKLKGAAGVFSAPVILPALAEFFEGDIETFQKFISDNARNNFNINVPEKKVEIVKEEWRAPYIVGEIKPMFAGKIFKFKVIS